MDHTRSLQQGLLSFRCKEWNTARFSPWVLVPDFKRTDLFRLPGKTEFCATEKITMKNLVIFLLAIAITSTTSAQNTKAADTSTTMNGLPVLRSYVAPDVVERAKKEIRPFTVLYWNLQGGELWELFSCGHSSQWPVKHGMDVWWSENGVPCYRKI